MSWDQTQILLQETPKRRKDTTWAEEDNAVEQFGQSI